MAKKKNLSGAGGLGLRAVGACWDGVGEVAGAEAGTVKVEIFTILPMRSGGRCGLAAWSVEIVKILP